jgi:DNA-binding transcriptional LysR family regulator
MRSNFSIGDLEAFVAVAEALNFGEAARALNISTSALSRRIQKLESTLDTELLQRSTRDVRLTVAGLRVYSQAHELMEGVHELLDASDQNARYARRVVVSGTYSHSQTFIPPALVRFQERFPKVFVNVRSELPPDTMDGLRRGVVDLGICDTGLQEAGVEFLPFCRERMVLAAPAGHRLAGHAAAGWRDLAGERFIGIVRGSPVRVLLDFELARAGINLSPIAEVGNLHAALRCVASGAGVTATPEVTAAFMSPGIALVPLTDPEIVVERGLVRSQNRPLGPAAQAFWDCLVAEWGGDGVKRG